MTIGRRRNVRCPSLDAEAAVGRNDLLERARRVGRTARGARPGFAALLDRRLGDVAAALSKLDDRQVRNASLVFPRGPHRLD